MSAADGLLAGLAKLSLAKRARANDAFEHFIWAHSVHAAHVTAVAKGWPPVSLVNLRPGGLVRLRTSPGQVSGGPFTFAKAFSSSASVELHTGLYVKGRSGAKHEYDVVGVAGTVTGTTVDHTDLRWGIEAKLYQPRRSLSLIIPRAVVGAAYDLNQLWWDLPSPAPRIALVTTASLSPQGRSVLLHKGGKPRVRGQERLTLASSTPDLDAFARMHASAI